MKRTSVRSLPLSRVNKERLALSGAFSNLSSINIPVTWISAKGNVTSTRNTSYALALMDHYNVLKSSIVCGALELLGAQSFLCYKLHNFVPVLACVSVR